MWGKIQSKNIFSVKQKFFLFFGIVFLKNVKVCPVVIKVHEWDAHCIFLVLEHSSHLTQLWMSDVALGHMIMVPFTSNAHDAYSPLCASNLPFKVRPAFGIFVRTLPFPCSSFLSYFPGSDWIYPGFVCFYIWLASVTFRISACIQMPLHSCDLVKDTSSQKPDCK